jgi:hypothetical protein
MMAQLRSNVVEAVGPRAIHAVEDGGTIGVVAGLAFTEPVLAVLILTGLGATPTRAGPLAILQEISGLVRSDDARAQESYFVIGTLAGLGIGVATGSVCDPLISVGNVGGLL